VRTMTRKLLCRKSASGVAGHTLLELLIVLVLIAAAAALVAPVTLRAYANFKLRLAADSMAKLFQQGKSRALFEGRTYLVIFSPNTGNERQIILAREDGKYVNQFSLPAEISLAVRGGNGEWTNDIDPLPFYPDGTSEALLLDLRNASRFPLRLAVDPITARTSIVMVNTDQE
jgi:Tfp pilus assembly protein FimT